MSDRLLKESDVIEAFKGREPLIHDVYTATAIIRSVPSADRPQGWIPCSERMPEEYQNVLISLEWDSVGIGWVCDGTWMCEWMSDCEDSILAWMPLPDPWEGADDE